MHHDDGRWDAALAHNTAVEFDDLRLAVLGIGTGLTHAWEYAWEASHAARFAQYRTTSVGNLATVYFPAVEHIPYLLPEKDRSDLANCLRTAFGLVHKGASSPEAYMQPALRHVKFNFPNYWVNKGDALTAMWAKEYAELTRQRYCRPTWSFVPPIGWQIVAWRLIVATTNGERNQSGCGERL